MPDRPAHDRHPLTAGLTAADVDLLRRRAARYAKEAEAAAVDVTDAAVFARGRVRYAVPLASLREIRPLRHLCRIPSASRIVPGVVHYRGEILSVHDLESFLAEQASGAEPNWVLVVEHEAERLGLMADEVIGIEPVAAGQLRPLPVTLGDRSACFQGILDGGVLMLKPAQLFSTPAFFAAF